MTDLRSFRLRAPIYHSLGCRAPASPTRGSKAPKQEQKYFRRTYRTLSAAQVRRRAEFFILFLLALRWRSSSFLFTRRLLLLFALLRASPFFLIIDGPHKFLLRAHRASAFTSANGESVNERTATPKGCTLARARRGARTPDAERE